MKCGFHIAPWLAARRQERPDEELDFWNVCWQALDDIAATHWDGVEVSQSQFDKFYDRPEELKAEFDSRGLELASYYFSRPFDEMSPAQAVELAKPRCEFHQALGSTVLLLDGGRRGNGTTDERIRALAQSVNAVAALARQYGLITPWHIHYGSMFERAAAFDRLMELTDPDLLTVCPDTAQMALGDYDLKRTFERYAERITYVHYKDIAFHDGAGGYLPHIPEGFCEQGAWGEDRIADVLEPGRGVVDVPALARILASAGFNGWVVVDLDYTLVPPLESSRITREYLAQVIPELSFQA